MADGRQFEFEPIFYPKSVAVIGASADGGGFGSGFLRSLLQFGYRGALYPVNPRGGEIMGLKAYPSVKEIPGPIDLAVVAVPAPAVPGVLEDCVAKGIRAAEVVTAGFREVGEAGHKLEERLTEISKKGIRVIGPNCFGVYCPAGGVTIMPGGNLSKESGPVAVLCQSGGMAIRIGMRGKGEGIRFSKMISYGNACDINEIDLLEYLAADVETRVIAAYLEGIQDGRRFIQTLRQVCKVKPVIIWKVGLTEGGSMAAQSHTGSLAGEEAVWQAVFKQTGAIRVDSLEELLDTALAFACLPPDCGRRLGIVGGGGAVGVAAADVCERAGLEIPALTSAMRERIAAILPPVGATARNPVDVGNPGPSPKVLEAVLENLAADSRLDTLIVTEINMAMRSRFGPDAGAQPLLTIPAMTREKFGKPVVVVLPVEAMTVDMLEQEGERREARDYCLSHGIPVYLTLERAIRALASVIEYYARVADPQ